MNHKSNSFIRVMCVLSYISVSRLQTFSFILCIWSILYAVDYQIVSQVKVLILLWAGFTHGRKPSFGPVELSLSLITAMGQDVYAENAGIYCAWDRLSDMNFFFLYRVKICASELWKPLLIDWMFVDWNAWYQSCFRFWRWLEFRKFA